MANGLRDKVTFAVNSPVVVTFGKFVDGKLSPSKFSDADQYMYTFADHRVAFVEPELHEMIQAHRPETGTTLAITKREIRQGMQRYTKWDVQPYKPAPEATPASGGRNPFPVFGTPGEPDFEREMAKRRALAAQQAAATPQPPAPDAAHAAATARHAEPADALYSALKHAITAAATAEAYARQSGRDLIFSAEDIRAMALTVYIGRQKEAAR